MTGGLERVLDREYPGVARHWSSLNFLARDLVTPVMKPRSITWACSLWLDQGSQGACVGFALTHELSARPVVFRGLDANFAREVYFETQRRDQWEGGAYPGASKFYEGTSVLAAAKYAKERQWWPEYRWSLDVFDFVMAMQQGPNVIGVDWWTGMFEPDSKGFIWCTGQVEGGHSVLVRRVRLYWQPGAMRAAATLDEFLARVDLDRSFVGIHNSWGNDRLWNMTLSEFMKLFPSGEFAVPMRRRYVRG